MKEIFKQGMRAYKLLKELISDSIRHKYIIGGHVGHQLINVDETLRYNGLHPGVDSHDYLAEQIQQLQWRIDEYNRHPEFSCLNRRAAIYAKKVLGLMEKIRDSGIALPLTRS